MTLDDTVPIYAVHGTATSAAVWDPVRRYLPQMVALTRPRTGRLDDELAWLAEYAPGAVIVGMSGGATLGLALAGAGVRAHGYVVHEPAVGRLVPDLLTPVVDAFRRGGTSQLGRTLYGAQWSVEMMDDPRGADDVDATTAAELAMFRSFEPVEKPSDAAPCLVTTGSRSPTARHRVARALAAFGYETRTIVGASHFVAHERPARFAAVVREMAARTAGDSPTRREGFARFWW